MAEEKAEEEGGKGFEIIGGVTIALFAAVLAVNDLGGGKYGADELIAHNKSAEAYNWYQSKGIKQTLVDGQADLLDALSSAGAIAPDQQAGVAAHVEKLRTKSARYDKEKKEILQGSAVVGQENWAQDVEGEMGKVVGAEEWEVRSEMLGDAGDWFDLGTLFLQISLVLGAISLVVQSPQLKRVFFGMLVGGGIIGAVLTVVAYRAAWAVPA